MRVEAYENDHGLRDYFSRETTHAEALARTEVWGYLLTGLIVGLVVDAWLGLAYRP